MEVESCLSRDNLVKIFERGFWLMNLTFIVQSFSRLPKFSSSTSIFNNDELIFYNLCSLTKWCFMLWLNWLFIQQNEFIVCSTLELVLQQTFQFFSICTCSIVVFLESFYRSLTLIIPSTQIWMIVQCCSNMLNKSRHSVFIQLKSPENSP